MVTRNNKVIKLSHSVFSINGEERFVGYTTGAHWNGWACPMFEFDEGKRLMEYVNKCSSDLTEYNMRYDAINRAFVYHDFNCDEDEVFKLEAYEDKVTGEILELYAIGSYSWIWDDMLEDDAERIVNNIRSN